MALSIGIRRRSTPLGISKLASVLHNSDRVYPADCLPFVWSLMTSFKTLPESAQYPPTGIPVHPDN